MKANAEIVADATHLLRLLEVIHELPIEHDENGHAFKRIPCRSMFDLGAAIGALFPTTTEAQDL